MALAFPFVEISMAAKVFSVCPNRAEIIEKCPEVEEKWIDFARGYQLGSLNKDSLSKLSIEAETEEEAVQMVEYINCVCGDYGFPKAQEKWKVLGWLFSVALTEFPSWANKY